MDITAAHWVYLLGLASLIVVMALRKNVVVPAVAATFVTALVFTGSVTTGLSSVFRASLTAAAELFSIFLIIALITALLTAMRAIGAERRMVAPFRRLMVNGPVAYVVLFVVTYVFSLFFWPTPTLALIAAILLPAAIRAGLSPMGGAIAIALSGQGMSLASDYVIGVAPSLSASGAGVPAGMIADRALVLSWIVGGVAMVMSYLLTVRHTLVARVTDQVAELAQSVQRRGEVLGVAVAG
ncbi:MAG: permease, partial [Actinomycetota bacterium]